MKIFYPIYVRRRTNRSLFRSIASYLYGEIIDGKPRRMSISEACEFTVARNGIGSSVTTFDLEVKRLRQAWMRERSTSSSPPRKRKRR